MGVKGHGGVTRARGYQVIILLGIGERMMSEIRRGEGGALGGHGGDGRSPAIGEAGWWGRGVVVSCGRWERGLAFSEGVGGGVGGDDGGAFGALPRGGGVCISLCASVGTH